MSDSHRPQAPIWIRSIMVLGFIILIIPLLTMITGAFIDQSEFSLRWFVEVLGDRDIQAALGRSVYLAICSSLVSTFLGFAMSLGIERYAFAGKKILHLFSMIALLLPELVFALSLLSWFVVIQLELSLITVAAAHITFSISFSALVIGSRILQLDTSLEDAARDLGASEVGTLIKVILPQLSGAILSSFLICLILSFDDFLITFFVSGVGQDTLPIKLFTSTKMGFSPKYNALASLMIFVTSCLALVLMRIGLSSPAEKQGAALH